MKINSLIKSITVCLLVGALSHGTAYSNASTQDSKKYEFKVMLEESSERELVKLDVTRLPYDLKEIALDAKEKLPWHFLQQLPAEEKQMIADRNVYLAGFLLPTLPIDSKPYNQAIRDGRLTPRGYNDRVIETIEVRPGQTTRTVEFSRGAGSKTEPFVSIRSGGSPMTLSPCGNYYTFSVRGSGIDIPPGPDRPDLEEVIEIEIEPEPVEETRSGLNRDRNRHPSTGVVWNGGNTKRPVPPPSDSDDTELGAEGGSPEYATGRIPSGVPGRGYGTSPGRSHRGGTGR